MRRASVSELFAWSLVGLGLGLVAGFALGEWLGPVDRDRVRRSVTRLRNREDQATPPLRPFEAIRAARRTLQGDPQLRSLKIDARAARPGVVELHGWVPSRALRARAARRLVAVDGIEAVVNRLLVEGEDDASFRPGGAADQPA